jgi:hypothetical protein
LGFQAQGAVLKSCLPFRETRHSRNIQSGTANK